MAGFQLGKFIAHPADNGAQVFLFQCSTNAVPAEPATPLGLRGVAQFHKPAGCLTPQVLVLRPLHHAPQTLQGLIDARAGQAIMFVEAPLGPAVGAFNRLFLVKAGIQQGGELVEGEHDVRAELVLNLHGYFWGEAVLGAIDHAAEVHAFFVHVGPAVFATGADIVFFQAFGAHGQDFFEAHSQAHHLEATRVGIGRPVPVFKRGDTPGLIHNVWPWLKVQVVGVGKHGLRARISDLLGSEGFHAGFRTHRNKRWGGNIAVRGVDHPGTTVACTMAPIAVTGCCLQASAQFKSGVVKGTFSHSITVTPGLLQGTVRRAQALGHSQVPHHVLPVRCTVPTVFPAWCPQCPGWAGCGQASGESTRWRAQAGTWRRGSGPCG